MSMIIAFILGSLFGAVLFYILQKNNKISAEQFQNQLQTQMQLQFENLANKALKENSNEFASRNKEKLEEFFTKFKEKIEDFQRKSEINFKEESEKLTAFDENIKLIRETSSKISHETNSLANVMKSDNRKQGVWGEIVLERVLEASGLRKDSEFVLQKGVDGQKPDAVVFLPEEKRVFIDAKTSFASWNAYSNSSSEEEQDFHLKAFKESTKAHIKGLADRDYSAAGGSPEYVLMFIPVESCYSLMFCDDNQLWDLAWKNKIMPVSPSTLLAALKIINAFYVVDRQNQNALEISKVCSEMVGKVADLTKDMVNARKNIMLALKKLDGTGNILTKIEKIRLLGVKIDPKKEDNLGLSDEIKDELVNI